MFDHADEMVRDKRGMTFAEWESLARRLAKALEGHDSYCALLAEARKAGLLEDES